MEFWFEFEWWKSIEGVNQVVLCHWANGVKEDGFTGFSLLTRDGFTGQGNQIGNNSRSKMDEMYFEIDERKLRIFQNIHKEGKWMIISEEKLRILYYIIKMYKPENKNN